MDTRHRWCEQWKRHRNTRRTRRRTEINNALTAAAQLTARYRAGSPEHDIVTEHANQLLRQLNRLDRRTFCSIAEREPQSNPSATFTPGAHH